MNKKLLNESEGYHILNKNGIPVPEHRVANDGDQAVKVADEIGFPVVMKIISPQVIHKSDTGGVVAGIENKEQVQQAFNDIMGHVKEKLPDAEITGVIVEKQMAPGLELIIGGKTDPAFGKVMTFGLGGTLVELIKDVVIRVLPIDTDEIRKMIRELKSYPLIKGYRGEAPKDEAGLAETIDAVCKWFVNDSQVVEFDINPLILYEKGACAVDARIYVSDDAVDAPLKKKKKLSPEIFYPESIAVVGASSDAGKVGYAVFRNLLEFPGKLYPVNLKKKVIMGRKAHPSLSQIPDPVDLVVICVPAAAVPEVIEEAGTKGVRLAVIISAGFREIGEQGKVLEQKVLAAAQKHQMRIVGPNCLGFILPHKKINATFDPATPRPGRLAFLSQSGAVITTVVDWSMQEGVGLSAVISVGNQIDMGFDELLEFTYHDKDTSTVILYVEEIRDGRSFMKVVGDVAKEKHVIAIKSGASKKGRQAASSHTGSLAGSYDVYMAMFKQSGVIVAHSLKEAFQIGELLASEGYPRGKRAIIITNAGGFAVLASDYAEEYGIDVATLSDDIISKLNTFLTKEWSHENPMDLVGDAGVDRYAKVFDLMIDHQDMWDIAFVVSVPTSAVDPRHLAKEIVRFSKHTQKMIVGCLLGGHSMKSGVQALRDSSIPNFSELEEAFKTVGKSLPHNIV